MPSGGPMRVDLTPSRVVTTYVVPEPAATGISARPAGGGPPSTDDARSSRASEASDGSGGAYGDAQAPGGVRDAHVVARTRTVGSGGGSGTLPASRSQPVARQGRRQDGHLRLARGTVCRLVEQEDAFGLPCGVLIDPCPRPNQRQPRTSTGKAGGSTHGQPEGEPGAQADGWSGHGAVPLLRRVPLRCDSCAAIVNPLCRVSPGGNSWTCAFCAHANAGCVCGACSNGRLCV